MSIPKLSLDGIYQIQKKIGQGSFGKIYLGTVLLTGDEVAIKLEKSSIQYPQLSSEHKIYQSLQGCPGIPKILWYGSESGYNILVLELLGPSLDNLFTYCKRKFSLKTVLMILDQLIRRIEVIHSQHYLHRDIKPDNFLIGFKKKAHVIHAIDFGLAKRFEDPKTLRHVTYKQHYGLIGTARFASLNSHLGVEMSRRDDLESVFYVMVYFLKGMLPWQGLKGVSKKEKYQKILERKLNMHTDMLCRGIPEEFIFFINYARSLGFDEKPDYEYLKELVREMIHREGWEIDFSYDWVLVNKARSINSRNEEKKTVNDI